MKTLITTLTSTLLLATAFVASPAHADDSKIFAGEMCNPSRDDSNVTHYWGRLKNNSPDPINFECPIVRDTVSKAITQGNAWVINQSYSRSLSCTLGMLLPLSGGTNSVSGYFSTRSTAVVSSAPQMLSGFGSLGNLTNGYSAMICNVPGTYNGQQSGVVSYRIDEDT